MKKKYSYGFAILMGLFCASMLVTFIVVDSKKAATEIEVNEQINNNKTLKVIDNKDDFKDYIEDTEDISIAMKGNQGFQCNKKDLGVIYAKLRLIKKIKLPDNDDGYTTIKDLESIYSIINEDDNYQIEIYEEGLIEVIDNEANTIFSTVEISEVIEALDLIVIDNLVKDLFKSKHDAININLLDDNNTISLSRRQLKDIGKHIDIVNIERTHGNISASIYPNYNINIGDGLRNYDIYITNEKQIRLVSTNYDITFNTTNELWKYLDLRFPVRNIIAEDDIRYLLKNDEVQVVDMYDDYDISTDGGYRLILAREIIKLDGDIILDKDAINNEFLQYTLSFEINSNIKDVNIYQNYYTYNDTVFYYEGVSDRVKSLVMLP